MKRSQVYYLNRTLICVTGLLSIGSLFIPTPNLFAVIADILLRTYLVFVGTVMAHEGVHGQLGHSRAENFYERAKPLQIRLNPPFQYSPQHGNQNASNTPLSHKNTRQLEQTTSL